MSPSSLWAAAGLAAALFCASAHAEDVRLDHRGSLGLLLGGGADYRALYISGRGADAGVRFPLQVGGTMAIGHDGNELKLLGAVELGSSIVSALSFGYRSYFGDEAFKTFADVDLRAEVTPAFTVGPRLGFGLQYELGPLVGLFVAAGVHFGIGNGIRFGGEATAGVQLRSYLLE